MFWLLLNEATHVFLCLSADVSFILLFFFHYLCLRFFLSVVYCLHVADFYIRGVYRNGECVPTRGLVIVEELIETAVLAILRSSWPSTVYISFIH